MAEQKYTIETEKIDNTFTYHAPFGTQQLRYENIRNSAKALAFCIAQYCPDSREKSLAMTKLEEAVMWANASIARNEQPAEADSASR